MLSALHLLGGFAHTKCCHAMLYEAKIISKIFFSGIVPQCCLMQGPASQTGLQLYRMDNDAEPYWHVLWSCVSPPSRCCHCIVELKHDIHCHRVLHAT